MIYYIYEVPGHKNGATNDWDKRSQQNFEKYRIHPVVIETMEGPNTPEMWQIVGDREWELADINGYTRGTHYRVAREHRPVWNSEMSVKAGQTRRLNGTSQNGGFATKGVKKPIEWRKNVAFKAATKASLINWTCTHCNKSGIGAGNLKRWHGDNCKHKA